MEGVAYSLRDSLDDHPRAGRAGEADPRLRRRRARAALWRQMQADVFGQNVVTINAEEGPAYGVALLAAVGAGAFKNVEEACAATIRVVSRTAAGQAGGQAVRPRLPRLSGCIRANRQFSGDWREL